MAEPTLDELNESIEMLSSYRDRLKTEFSNVAEKLQMPKTRVDFSLKNHSEINQIEKTLEALISQRELKINHLK